MDYSLNGNNFRSLDPRLSTHTVEAFLAKPIVPIGHLMKKNTIQMSGLYNPNRIMEIDFSLILNQP